MKSVKQYIVTAFSTRSVGVFIFMITAVLLTLILSSRYFMYHSIVENGVSKRDVFATKDYVVEDTLKTAKFKDEIVKKVAPIYVPIPDDFIKNNLDKNLNMVDKVRRKNVSDDEKSVEMVLGVFNIEPDDLHSVRNIDHIVKLSDAHYDKIEATTKTVLNDILNEGINETDIQNNLNSIIKKNTPKYVNSADYNTIAFLIKSVITPNRIIDEDATELSKKTAADSIKPVMVTFKKGSKIVSTGQAVSKVQREALKLSGTNVIQLNLSGIFGIFMLVVLSLFTCAYYIDIYEPQFKRKAHYSLVAFLMLLLSVFAATIPHNYLVFMPIAAFTMLIGIFLNGRTALITSLTFLCAIAMAFQLQITGVIIFALGIFATVFALNAMDYTKRPELTKVGLITSLVYAVSAIAAFFLEYNLTEMRFETFGTAFLCMIANGIICSFVAFGLMPILESMFKIATPYGLVELANSNNPLLQKLQEKAPGTYNHSQNVAILAEAAAEAIGANVILTKIGALYHDVGKINRPLFFFENQSFVGIENPHNKFTPKFSKMVITTHPRDGVDIAKEYKISPIIYPLILEHHGDSIASYFYNEAVKQEGKENVSEDEFRYNAPKPTSKESAIIMLADGAESAVRSLKNPSSEEIEAKVDVIIKAKLNDGQLSDSPLTLKDLKIIETTFNRVLKGMHHQRIKYHEDFDKIQEKVAELEEKRSGN